MKYYVGQVVGLMCDKNKSPVNDAQKTDRIYQAEVMAALNGSYSIYYKCGVNDWRLMPITEECLDQSVLPEYEPLINFMRGMMGVRSV